MPNLWMFLCVLVEDLYDWSFTFPKARIGTLTLRLKTTQLMSWVVKTDGFLLLLLISGLFQRSLHPHLCSSLASVLHLLGNMCYSTSKQELVINISWHYVFMAIRITRLKLLSPQQLLLQQHKLPLFSSPKLPLLLSLQHKLSLFSSPKLSLSLLLQQLLNLLPVLLLSPQVHLSCYNFCVITFTATFNTTSVKSVSTPAAPAVITFTFNFRLSYILHTGHFIYVPKLMDIYNT